MRGNNTSLGSEVGEVFPQPLPPPPAPPQTLLPSNSEVNNRPQTATNSPTQHKPQAYTNGSVSSSPARNIGETYFDPSLDISRDCWIPQPSNLDSNSTHIEDGAANTRLLGSPAELESPGDVSLGESVVDSDQSVQSDHSRARLLTTSQLPTVSEKEPADDDTVVYDTDEDMDEESNRCGFGCWSPECVQSWANVKSFLFTTCFLALVASTLSTGYVNSVITTIEKRFEIGSSSSGIVPAAYEFGNLLAVIFVSFLGASRHMPRWIGSGVLVMAIGSILFALPHVIAPKYTVRSGIKAQQDRNRQFELDQQNLLDVSYFLQNSSSYTQQSNLTSGPQPSTSPSGHSLEEEYICRKSGDAGSGSDGEHCRSDKSAGNWGYVLLIVAAQVLIGTGGTPIMTLGITYVDNHVSKEKSPSYLACVHASSALGPVLGYALGALLLQYYVDTFSHAVPLSPSSPRWVGAWWGGFIICGLLLLMLVPIFFSFPPTLVREKKRLRDAKEKSAVDDGVDDGTKADYGKSYKDIPKAVLHLFKNPIYVTMLPAICCEVAIVSGFVVFLPKYLETQFGTSTSQANLFTGGIGIPGAGIGILTTGYIMKKMSLTPKGAIQFVLLLNTLALCGFMFFFVLGCNNVKIAGANYPYFNSSGHKIFEANLTSACNQNCACSNNHIQPICGVNGITYFSPCHAGCTGSNHFYDEGKEEKSFNYSGCSCISAGASSMVGRSDVSHDLSDSNSDKDPPHHEVIISPLATHGACKNRCERLLPFLILLVGMTFCVAGTQMPLLMVTLRSVQSKERSFAIGLQFVVMRLFAYIPSPILLGMAIDTSCLLWSVKCKRNGSCLLYDIEHFRILYIGYSAGLKVISLCFFVAVWYFIRRRANREKAAELLAANPESTPLSPTNEGVVSTITPANDEKSGKTNLGEFETFDGGPNIVVCPGANGRGDNSHIPRTDESVL